MAGDWLKMEMELSDKPEVHYIANALSLDPDAVVGKLFRVWSWFNKHTIDGNAHGVTYSLLDRITSVAGFGEAMAFAGWLEQRDKTLHMPNFEYHTSESAKKRALTAKRAANHRQKSNAESNADSVTNALPREEKRREEERAGRASRLPATWEPSDSLKSWFSENRPDLDLLTTASNFRDHWKAASGAKARKHDWEAAFRTWARNERSGGHIQAQQPVKVDL